MEPYYEPPLNSFEEQFKMTLANCKRQKAECGSTITRVAEISSMFSLDIYKRVCLSVFKGMLSLFTLTIQVDNTPLHMVNISRQVSFLQFPW